MGLPQVKLLFTGGYWGIWEYSIRGVALRVGNMGTCYVGLWVGNMGTYYVGLRVEGWENVI